MGKGLKRGSLTLGLALTLALAGGGDFRPTAVDLLIAPYKYSFVNWEVSHVPDKWLSKVRRVLTWGSGPDRPSSIARAQEFFELGVELRRLERQAQFSSNAPNTPNLQPDSPPKNQRSSPSGLFSEREIARIKARRLRWAGGGEGRGVISVILALSLD